MAKQSRESSSGWAPQRNTPPGWSSPWASHGLAGLVLSCVACVVCFGLFWAAQRPWVPQDAIGFAQGSTSIQVEGAVDLSPVLLVLGVAALALAVFFLWKLLRGRRSDR